jgi:branched-chain amino acid transport system ATP-binding protein
MSRVLSVHNVRKHYQALRPLRVKALAIEAGERVALSGLDAGAAEVLVNLVTGASLPDEGDVEVLGVSTASITDGDQWLASLDRFGIVSPRAVLLEGATLLQNLAMPLTLDIEPVPADVVERVHALARLTGIDPLQMDRPIAQLSPAIRARIHVARAIALEPALLILEHPTATLAAPDRRQFGEDVKRAAVERQLATLIISEDDEFSRVAADRRYALNAATGELTPRRTGWFR